MNQSQAIAEFLDENLARLRKATGVDSPLLHTTTQAVSIVARGGGIQAGKESRFGQGNVNTISTTRSWDVATSGNFGNTVLVLDKADLKKRFKIKPIQRSDASFEAEERIVAGSIPVKHIKAMVTLVKPIRGGQEFGGDPWPQDVKYLWFDGRNFISLPVTP